MAEDFTKFVLNLAQDPRELAEFQKNPGDVMGRAGLTRAEQSILTSGSATVIRNAITADIGPDQLTGDLAGSPWPIWVLVAVTVVVAAAEAETPT